MVTHSFWLERYTEAAEDFLVGWWFLLNFLNIDGTVPAETFGKIEAGQLQELFNHPPPAFELTNGITTLGYKAVSVSCLEIQLIPINNDSASHTTASSRGSASIFSAMDG